MKNDTPYYCLDRLETVLSKAEILSSVCEYIDNLQDIYNERMYTYRERYSLYADNANDNMLTDCAKQYSIAEVKFDVLQTLHDMLQNYDF